MTRVTRGAGRDGALALVRPLLVAASHLQREGDTLSSAALSRLLGTSRAEARELIDLLLSTGDDEVPFYLPLLEDGDVVVLSSEPDYVCRGLRLSHLETMALAAALDRVGLEPANATRTRVMARFTCPDDTDTPSGETARPSRPDNTAVLMRCALAIVSNRALAFDYLGTKDDTARARRVRPKKLRQNGELWVLDAFDLDADGERTFFVANMSLPKLLDAAVPSDAEPADNDSERRVVTLFFSDPHLLDLLEWPDLEVIAEHNGTVEARIPFYGGPWLVRRIASGGGSITTTDERLSVLVKEHVNGLLESC